MHYTSLTIKQLSKTVAPGCRKTVIPNEQLSFNEWTKYIKEQLLVVIQNSPITRDNQKGRRFLTQVKKTH